MASRIVNAENGQMKTMNQQNQRVARDHRLNITLILLKIAAGINYKIELIEKKNPQFVLRLTFIIERVNDKEN